MPPELISRCFQSPAAFRLFAAWTAWRAMNDAAAPQAAAEIARLAQAGDAVLAAEICPHTGTPLSYRLIGDGAARLKGLDGRFPDDRCLSVDAPWLVDPLGPVRAGVVTSGRPVLVQGRRRLPRSIWLRYEAVYLPLEDGKAGASATLVGAMVPLGTAWTEVPQAGGGAVEFTVDRVHHLLWDEAWMCWTCACGSDRAVAEDLPRAASIG